MDIEEVKKLHASDEVFWKDPDNDECSKVMKILSIEIVGDIIKIEGLNAETGEYSLVECFASELE